MSNLTPLTGETYTDSSGVLWLRFQVGGSVIGTPIRAAHIAPGAHTEALEALAGAVLAHRPRPTTVRWDYDPDPDLSYLYQDCFREIDPSTIPADFPVRPISGPPENWPHPDDDGITEDGEPFTLATCGDCGLSWNDAEITSYTPAPSARCPFENWHFDPDSTAHYTASVCYVVTDQYGEHVDSLYGIDFDTREDLPFIGEHPFGAPPAELLPYQRELLAELD